MAAKRRTAPDEESAAEALLNSGATDGLPVVVPTPERVERMLEAGGLEPDLSLGIMPPRKGPTTVEKLAINAVMAGCRPAYFPVVIAATRAMLQKEFTLSSVQGRSQATGPMLIVNGPIRHRLGIASGPGCIGPGWHANATIGRAIRLILINVGGGRVGGGDGATLGSPLKFSFCFAEAEENSPWPPFHTSRGYAADDDVVTVAGAENTQALAQTWNAPKGPTAPSAEVMLNTMAASIVYPGGVLYGMAGSEPGAKGTYTTLVLGPPTVEILDQAGYTRETAQEALWERVRIPVSGRRRFAVMRTAYKEPWELDPTFDDPNVYFQPFAKPSDIQILVAGSGSNMLIPNSPLKLGAPCSEKIVTPRG